MTCRDFIANGTSVFVAPAIHLVVGRAFFLRKADQIAMVR